ncbi:DnaB-like helicase C-terminal domain-containing protein, partial [Enterobacter asburiae]
KDKLKAARPEPGLSWPWPELNKITLGIRKNQLFIIGAGSGVGKTEFLREVVKHLIEVHGESVGVISTEDPTVKVSR